jgi:hypothetical protein
MQKKLGTITTKQSALNVKMTTSFFFSSYEDTHMINTSQIIVSEMEIEISSFVLM